MLCLFFKDSLNKKAETLILELNEAMVYTLVKYKYWTELHTLLIPGILAVAKIRPKSKIM